MGGQVIVSFQNGKSGVIEDFKKRKKKISIKNIIIIVKNISWNLSGVFAGSVGSVQFQIAPCSSLHF